MAKSSARNGFSLIEALLVIAIISMLTTTSLFYLKPMDNMSKAKDSQRRTDVQTILNAIHQYALDHRGNFPVCIDDLFRNICAGKDCSGVSQSCNLYPIVGKYIVAIPVDPGGPDGNDSNYDVQMQGGRITVRAPEAEKTQVIQATR